jgi:cytochrome c2
MWKRVFLPVLIALAILFGSHFLGEVLFSIGSLEKPAYVTEVPSGGDKPEEDVGAASGDAKPTGNTVENETPDPDEDTKPRRDTLESETADNATAFLGSASPIKGAKLFKKCKSCHTTKKGGKNTIGPNLWDVVGRKIAGSKGFKYSEALKGKGGDWSFAALDAFLANPKSYAKGTKMSFRGVRKNEDRADLLVYLGSLSDDPKPLP